MRSLLLAACIFGLACRHQTEPSFAPPPSPSPAAPAQESVSCEPRVEIHFTDHTADEGAWSTTTLCDDGTFESEHEMSDGGATSTVTHCSGRMDPTTAENYLARLKADATLAEEPPVPGIGEAIDNHIEGSYRIQLLETGAWVDPARWDEARVRALFDQMAPSMKCTQSKR